MKLKTTNDFHQYQVDALKRLDEITHAGLMADMGTGKTITTLTHLALNGSKALVIAPLRVAETVWAEEARIWKHTKDMTFSHALGTPKQREAALARKADVYVINVENAMWLVKEHAQFLRSIDVLVLDELSLWKSTGKRWKSLYSVRDVFKSVIGLTGTPAPNGLLDLWPQMEMIKPGMITRTKTQYKQHFFFPVDPNGWKWMLRPNADLKIYRKIEPYVIRVSNDQLDMPELNVQRVAVPLPDAVTDMLTELKHEGVVDLPTTQIVAENPAALVSKMMQISNGAVYDDQQRPHFVHEAKLKAIRELVEELQGAPVLISYQFKHDLSALKRAWPDAPVLGGENTAARNNEIVRDWNAGKIPVLFGHPAAMGHGMNLQEGGHHVIFYGLTWNLEHYDQLIARVYRQGQQSRHVFVHLLCASDIDNRVADALIRKANVQQELLNYLAR